MSQGIYSFEQINLRLRGELSFRWTCPRCERENLHILFNAVSLLYGIDLACEKCGSYRVHFTLELDINGTYQSKLDE